MKAKWFQLLTLLVLSTPASALPSFQPQTFPLATPRASVTPVPQPSIAPSPTPTPDPYHTCMDYLFGALDCVDVNKERGGTQEQCMSCGRFCESLPPTDPLLPPGIKAGDDEVPPCSRSICYEVLLQSCGYPPSPAPRKPELIDIPSLA